MTAAKIERTTRRTILGTILALALACGAYVTAAAVTADEAAADPTTYTVRLYGGNRGTVAGQSMYQQSGVAYGNTVDLLSVPVAVTDGKYYAKGIRPAGQDNVKDVAYVTGPVTVTEDADYVVAYGVLANRVEYTVRYVDAAGSEIAASQTFTGDIGDMPAVAARYVENYVPDAYTASRALGENSSDNVITFTYSRLAAGYTTVQNADGTVGVVTPSGETVALAGGAPADVAPGTTPAEAGETAAVTTPEGEEILTDAGTPLAAPVESMTIEDDVAPLAAGNGAYNSNAFSWNWVSIVLAALGIVILIVAIVFGRKNRRAAKSQL